MSPLEALLILAALLCALTAGLVFAFASVVMPGIAKLDDKGFIRAFQVIDGIIQRGQPVFGLVWVGSALLLLMAAGLSIFELRGLERLLLCTAALCYLFGVQLPTFLINVPLNNALQRLDVATMSAAELATERQAFEGRWMRWNLIRTVVATLVSLTLLWLLLRL